MAGANSAEEYKLMSSFEAVRKTLLEERFSDRLDRPLAYWALPNDRRLPLAFLGRSVGDLLQTPFGELTATRGVGQKKISSLVKLLERASSGSPPTVPFGVDNPSKEGSSAIENEDGGLSFDPSTVSEVLWDRWRSLIADHTVANETLGRLCVSLQDLPTVIWQTKLKQYLGQSLSEIRHLRTHGEKRVASVLAIVHSVYEVLEGTERQPHLDVTVQPRFIQPIESAVAELADHPSFDVLRERVVVPLLSQIKEDVGETVYALAQSRLGVLEDSKTVRELSVEMGVTRARVYQLLEDCARVMKVRWPEGKSRLESLTMVFSGFDVEPRAATLLAEVIELFFPNKYLKIAGSDREEELENVESTYGELELQAAAD